MSEFYTSIFFVGIISALVYYDNFYCDEIDQGYDE